ncbi:MAG: polysaccharide biosynthesis/export family protein [Pirellula sp.]|jgi:protein involved in polysaccharide export with SLBB domain|nr:polysaccharide biosynthesis/export family protein [Pirellula sp.]
MKYKNMSIKQNFNTRSMSWLQRASSIGLALLGMLSAGCSTITQPISGIPARRIPPQFLAQSKNNLVPLDPARLSQEPPRDYLLDDGDILGIYIEGILPFVPPDRPPEPPPVNFPDATSQLDPSLGFPIAVINDGTIQLPNLEPIKVRGLTIDQTRDLIRKYYLDSEILRESSRLQPIVTLMKERTYNVIVIRQDMGALGGGGAGGAGQAGFTRATDYSATGRMLKLKAYQNDVLNALMESGGLPGVNAKNEVKILRASRADQRRRDEFVQQFYQQYYCNPDPCGCPPPLPEDPSILKIPLRLPPGAIPEFGPENVVLEDGDIVYIESRDAEVFYTGGLLPGGEFKIPRDYDLDVLTAMALSGGGISRQQNGGGGGGGMGGIGGMVGQVPPGMLYVLRKTPCNGQITIAVDLAKANVDPRERILVQPGDILVLRFKPSEEILNFSLGTFFTFGIQYALREL